VDSEIGSPAVHRAVEPLNKVGASAAFLIRLLRLYKGVGDSK